MNINEALRKGIEILKNANNEAPVIEAGAILCSVLKCDKTFLYSHNDHILSSREYDSFIGQIKARANGKPMQYITGHQEFMSLDFNVTSDVLIPRQDTEILVETVIKHCKTFSEVFRKQPIPYNQLPATRILDIGTGSGCIAISLAYYLKECHVTAVDISQKALDTAKRNAERIGVENRTTFLHSNLFEQLRMAQSSFDIIVSNPPYIPASDIKELQIEVRDYEPLGALAGGEDGLDFYRRITQEAPGFLSTGGLLAFEVGYDQAQEVSKLMSKCYEDIQIIKDLSGIDRVVTGRLSSSQVLNNEITTSQASRSDTRTLQSLP